MINKSPSYPPLLRTLDRLQGVFWRRRLILGLIRTLWVALLIPTLTLAAYLWGGLAGPLGCLGFNDDYRGRIELTLDLAPYQTPKDGSSA